MGFRWTNVKELAGEGEGEDCARQEPAQQLTKGWLDWRWILDRAEGSSVAGRGSNGDGEAPVAEHPGLGSE